MVGATPEDDNGQRTRDDLAGCHQCAHSALKYSMNSTFASFGICCLSCAVPGLPSYSDPPPPSLIWRFEKSKEQPLSNLIGQHQVSRVSSSSGAQNQSNVIYVPLREKQNVVELCIKTLKRAAGLICSCGDLPVIRSPSEKM